MKTNRPHKTPAEPEPMVLKEALPASSQQFLSGEPMVRTQIYLSRTEHEFVRTEASRRSQPMAAVIRSYIEDRMRLPEDAWTQNPILAPAPMDPAFVSHEDGAINHDHYIYGCPKKHVRVRGGWAPAPAATEAEASLETVRSQPRNQPRKGEVS